MCALIPGWRKDDRWEEGLGEGGATGNGQWDRMGRNTHDVKSLRAVFGKFKW